MSKIVNEVIAANADYAAGFFSKGDLLSGSLQTSSVDAQVVGNAGGGGTSEGARQIA